jgi:N-methylhydantoinase A
MAGSVRLGIDIGGTFTDIVLLDEASGDVRIAKVPSTPRTPAAGFLRGVDWALGPDGVDANSVRYLAHGTTVATNAVIEGRIAPTALLVTRGFRDILEIARQTRPDLFDLFAEKPRPIVPRHLVYEIRERRDPSGEVLEPLSETDVERAVRAIRDNGIQAVAICFLHS